MGQRTATILKIDYECQNEKKSSTAVFYHSWGIGRVLFAQLQTMLLGMIGAEPDLESSRTANDYKPVGTSDITKDYNPTELDGLDFAHPEKIGEVIQNADNNNGGLFLHVRYIVDENYNETFVPTFAFMLGDEDGGDYKHFCTLEEFAEKVGERYVNEDFLRSVYATLDYFGAIDYAYKLD